MANIETQAFDKNMTIVDNATGYQFDIEWHGKDPPTEDQYKSLMTQIQKQDAFKAYMEKNKAPSTLDKIGEKIGGVWDKGVDKAFEMRGPGKVEKLTNEIAKAKEAGKDTKDLEQELYYAKNWSTVRRVGIPAATDIATTILSKKLPIHRAKDVPKLLSALRKTGSGLASPAGSFSGSFGGSLLADFIDGKRMDAKNAAVEGGVGAATEILPPVLKGAEKLASKFTKAGQRAAKAELVRLTDEATTSLQNRGVGAPGGLETAEEVEQALMKSLPTTDSFFTGYTQAYKNNALANPGESVSMKESLAYLEELGQPRGPNGKPKNINQVLKSMGIKAESQYGLVIREIYADGMEHTTVDQMKRFLDDFWSGENVPFGKLHTPAQGRRLAFKLKLLEDLEKGKLYTYQDEAGKWIETSLGQIMADQRRYADTMTSDFMENVVKQNPTLKKALANSTVEPGKKLWEAKPGLFFDNLLINTKPAQLARFKTEVLKSPQGKQAWDAFEFNFLNTMLLTEKSMGAGTGLRSSSVLIPTMKFNSDTGAYDILPGAIARNIETMMPKVRAIFPESVETLEKAAREYTFLSEQIRKGKDVKGTALSYLGPGVGFYLMGPAGIAVAEVSGFVAGQTLTRPGLRKALEVARLATTKPLAHGAKEFISGDRN